MITNQVSGLATIQWAGPSTSSQIHMNYDDNENSLAFYSYTAASKIFRLYGNGNIGIGTQNPIKKLHVNGNFRVDPYYTTGGDRDFVDIIAHDTDTQILSNNEPFHVTNNTGPIILRNTGGNVGIGTTNPTEKLHVNGNIRAAAPVWADFVFAKEYQLPSLKYVESFISVNCHLEDIPSEEEVFKDGVNLTAMDAKLLQKIEELTLYLIEQNKRIERLEERNSLLEKMIGIIQVNSKTSSGIIITLPLTPHRSYCTIAKSRQLTGIDKNSC